MNQVETVIIGGGQSGLAMSYYLRAMGREHIVLERARVADAWHTQRWDSLRFQSPNWSLTLPGWKYGGGDTHGFASRSDVQTFIEDYAVAIHAPVQIGVQVERLRRGARTGRFELVTNRGAFVARNVVVATGPYQQPWLPDFALQLPEAVAQLHSSSYRCSDQLPPGNVLVVGSGASGCQIAEDLLGSGRRIYLSVSPHTRAPRTYRGKDVFAWRKTLGHLDQTTAVPAALRHCAPLITGVGGGHDVDIRNYADKGMVLLGRANGALDATVSFASDLMGNLQRGDESFHAFQRAADDHLATNDDGDRTDDRCLGGTPTPVPAPLLTTDHLDLRAESIANVIWATGYTNAYPWIAQSIVDARGPPEHKRGISTTAGIYFLGLSWLHKATSSFLCGVAEDAEHLAKHIATRRDADMAAPTWSP